MKLNLQIFHDFFYSGNSYQAGKSATHYTRGHFFSYATEIGYIYHGEDNCYLFVSESTFSSTTASHRNALICASPLPRIYVPFQYGDDFTRDTNIVGTMKNRFLENLLAFKPENFTRKMYRDDFNNLLYNLRKFLEVTAEKITTKNWKKINGRRTSKIT